MKFYTVLALALLAIGTGPEARARNFGWYFAFSATDCASSLMGYWSSATDAYDPTLDLLMNPSGQLGAAALYRENGPDWGGPSGLYRCEFRELLAPDRGSVWQPIYF
jgi:hypothetical protein